MIREIRLFGLSEDDLREQLCSLLDDPALGVTLSVCEGHGVVTLPADAQADRIVAEVTDRLSGYVYGYEGDTLAALVVRVLREHGLTVATAESCTGGMIAAALTDVPGASQVFGTGVVSYSNSCKEAMLAVSADTLAESGAVSAETAGQMARGVRRTAKASIGVAVTGEAGPLPAEAVPVGTVYIALADKKRTWVEELHLDGPDRASIRRQATDYVLWLLWRYLSAYPAVMAGGESHVGSTPRQIPRTQGAAQPRLLSRLLPWRGDPWKRMLVKLSAWIAVVALLIGSLFAGYQYFFEPDRNRELQDSLGDVYRNESADLTDGYGTQSHYPEGMMATFRGLYDMNSDVAGWLSVPGTGIDYPVMQYADGYYRNHSFTKQLSIYGQLYFGKDNENGKYNRVYGQNTEDGQMLSDLLNYRRIAYLQEHPYIECSTLYERAQYEIFAVFVIDDRNTDEFSLTEGVKSYADFLSEVLNRSLFLSDAPVTEEDEFLLLSTDAQTEYGFAGARLAVMARRMSGSESEPVYRVNEDPRMPRALKKEESTRHVTTT